LARQVRITTNSHAKALYGQRRRQSSNAENRRNLSTVSSWEIEET
jgi:hypothetical protein